VGNGAFESNWSLSTLAITRKIGAGLLQYDDATESDVFTLAGADDLAPV
jgi:hypothetical protein